MSQENVELVRSIYAAWAGGHFLGSADWAHPEIQLIVVDGPSPGTWTGLAGMAKGAGDVLDVWEDVRVEAEEYRALDEQRVLALIKRSGRGRTSGLEIAQAQAEGAHLFHVRGHKVARLVFYWDRDRALADLGIEE